MNYVLERITTVQACDALLTGAQKKKQNLERRVRNLGEALATFRKRIAEIRDESMQVRLLLELFTGVFGSLSEGKDKVNLNIRIKRLELQETMLGRKATAYNVGALLAKELQYNNLASQVSALEDYITAVAQRRLALEAPTLRIVQPAVMLPQPVAGPVLTPPVLSLPKITVDQGVFQGKWTMARYASA